MSSPQAGGNQAPGAQAAKDTLGIPTQLKPAPQPIQDQEGDSSPIQIGTNSVVIANGASFGFGIVPQFPVHVAPDYTVRFELGANSQLQLGGQGAFNVDAPGVTAGRFTVTNGGNVGINQANPQYALDVSGEIHSTGGLLVTGLATVSQAPNAENLCSLFYDPTTGGFYYQS